MPNMLHDHSLLERRDELRMHIGCSLLLLVQDYWARSLSADSIDALITMISLCPGRSNSDFSLSFKICCKSFSSSPCLVGVTSSIHGYRDVKLYLWFQRVINFNLHFTHQRNDEHFTEEGEYWFKLYNLQMLLVFLLDYQRNNSVTVKTILLEI